MHDRDAVERVLRAAADGDGPSRVEEGRGERRPDARGAAGDEDDALCGDEVLPMLVMVGIERLPTVCRRSNCAKEALPCN
jgi:hypothetical protein